jgi:hypothetical protein
MNPLRTTPSNTSYKISQLDQSLTTQHIKIQLKLFPVLLLRRNMIREDQHDLIQCRLRQPRDLGAQLCNLNICESPDGTLGLR